MKSPLRILFLIFLLSAITVAEETEVLAPISRAEADALVAQQMNLAQQREKERLQSINAARALSTWQSGRRTQKIIMRRLAAKPWPLKKSPDQAVAAGTWTEEQWAEWRAARKQFRTIQLSATVFNRKLSEIQWRKDGVEFMFLSNVDFNYLSMIGWVESGQTHWSTFFFVNNVDSEREQRFARLAEANGRLYVPRPVPDGSMLDSEKADYVIYAEPGAEVPVGLVEEMDALHQHYASNEQALKVRWLNRQQLNKATRAWLEAHPPVPKDTVINFWPVRSRTNGKN